ncbi:MAG: helix-turn-helix transcriptional regulator [Verrucomicrobiota bacterium]
MQIAIASRSDPANSLPDTVFYNDDSQDSASLSDFPNTQDYLAAFKMFLGHLQPSQGFLLLDKSGQLIQSTAKARQLCLLLQAERQSASQQSISLPYQVIKLYELLMDSRIEFPGQPLQMFEKVMLDNGVQISINAEWVYLGDNLSHCLLVKLENVSQTMNQRALCDACRYNFTPREIEVWALCLQGLSRSQISQRLFITMNTVVKHMKSIRGKRGSTII